MKMVAGAINPGRPVANLYVRIVKTVIISLLIFKLLVQFAMWSHDVVATSIGLAGDLKMGQYLKIPPRMMFAAQIWGTILGKPWHHVYFEDFYNNITIFLGAIVNYGKINSSLFCCTFVDDY